jgi:hypothetical protein
MGVGATRCNDTAGVAEAMVTASGAGVTGCSVSASIGVPSAAGGGVCSGGCSGGWLAVSVGEVSPVSSPTVPGARLSLRGVILDRDHPYGGWSDGDGGVGGTIAGSSLSLFLIFFISFFFFLHRPRQAGPRGRPLGSAAVPADDDRASSCPGVRGVYFGRL